MMIFLRSIAAKKGSLAALFLLFVFGISLVSSTLTYADIWTGRPYAGAGSYSYFDNKRLFSTNGKCVTGGAASVLPERYAGEAIPNTVNSVDTLIAFLIANNRQNDGGGSCNDGKWKKSGSAFIVHTMLGRTGDQANASGGRNISDADFADLRARLNAASINWAQGGVSTDGLNTLSVWNPANVSVDVAHFKELKTNTAIVITSAGGNVYKIFRQCANPVGVTNGITSAPKDYTLTPSVTVDRSIGEPGESTGIGAYVNTVGSVASSGTQWQLSRFVVPSGNAYAGGGNSPSAPAQYYGNNLTSLDSGSGASFPLGNNLFKSANDILPDVPVGSKVCYAFSVQPRAYNDNQWAHSIPICVVIAKSPSLQVLGGDLRVGMAFAGGTAQTSAMRTSVTVKTNKSYGSWGEYGLFAPGTITGTGSGSAYSQGINCVALCTTNTMSFANSPADGGFISTTNIPDVAASFPVTASTPTFGGLADAAQKRVETGSGAITIGGGNISKGQWLVINAPTATVTITGDITYDNGGLTSLGDIPQLIIIANQINIDNNVKNIDAWLIASGAAGTINTCSKSGASDITAATQLTINLCQNPLVINGPVMAKKMYFLRTAGSNQGAASSDPAEVINLRPDAYLWGIAHNANSGRLTTVYETELPPRF
ncbi:MAG TPA: hypothetical protein VIM37_02320 [Candidatus Microsaccharimonas sp.]|jgi:hypothetical protein